MILTSEYLQGRKYKIVRFIGSGGFGCTYEATHVMLGKRLAIKEFFVKDLCNRDSATGHISVGVTGKSALVNRLKEKFIEEAVALSEMSHPNIVKVIDVFEENGTAYYVMDYIDGLSLDDIVKRRGPLPEDEAISYIGQVAGALSYVHSLNRLHLDVKPGNIMVKPNGEAILIDFGVSKQYDEVDGENTSTLLGKTPGYAPLEQMENNIQTFTPATDIYALGATMFKMLTGHTPPTASHILNKGLPLDELKEKGVDANIVQLVTRCMKPVYEDRYQTVQDFQSDLKRVYSGTSEEETEIDKDKEESDEKDENRDQSGKTPQPPQPPQPPLWLKIALFGVVLALIIGGVLIYNNEESPVLTGEDFDIFADLSYDEMVYVEGGTFLMGAQSTDPNAPGYDSDADDDESPLHYVTVSSFYIGKYEVTQGLWEYVMEYSGTAADGTQMSPYAIDVWLGTNPSSEYGKGANYPAYNVSYEDIVEIFIPRLNKITGKTFRLPTEAEWEYAARGGNRSNGYKYSGSNDIDEVAWYCDNSSSKTHPVGSTQLRANELGLYDMSGNVWEWCSDWYSSNYYEKSSQNNPTGPSVGSSGSYRVDRGSGWFSLARGCRVSNRSGSAPSFRDDDLGFRLLCIKYNNQTISLDRSLQEEPKVEPVVDKTVEKPRQQNPEIEKLLNNMVYVAGGTFLMGAQSTDPNAPNYDSEAYDQESPVHSVTVSSFYMSKYEVTQGLWKAVMGINPSRFKGDNLPVECVSWDECQDFIAKLNELTGKEFRLPTEAEWEYAARGGNKSGGYKYSGSNTIDDVAWYCDNSSERTYPVGSKQPNELGLYDMSGNVWEWCSDYWRMGYNNTPSDHLVRRGGSWYSFAELCRVSYRNSDFPSVRYDYLGFRLVHR